MRKALTYLSGLGLLWPIAALAQTTDFDTGVTDQSADAAAAAVGAGMLGVGLLMTVVFGILGIVSFIIWIWALIDVIRRQFTNPSDKTLWIIIVVILGVLGAIVYLIAGRSKGTIPGKTAAPAAPATTPTQK